MTTTDTPRGQLRLRADLKCLVCGHVAGEAEGIYGRPIKLTRITPIGTPHWEVRPGEPVRCPRCAGRLHLDDIDMRRERVPAAPADRTALRRAS